MLWIKFLLPISFPNKYTVSGASQNTKPFVSHFNLFLKINATRNVDERIEAVVPTGREAVPPLSDIVEIDRGIAPSTNHTKTRIDVILAGSLVLIRDLEVDHLFKKRDHADRTRLILLLNEEKRSNRHLARNPPYLQLLGQKRQERSLRGQKRQERSLRGQKRQGRSLREQKRRKKNPLGV